MTSSNQQDTISGAQKLRAFIESLSDFLIVPPDIPYGHMGATICDAILQAGLKWETVVKPRLENLRRDHSSVATTSNFFNLIKEVGLKELLDWRDDEKPTRIRGITEFFVQEGVETESELKVWLKNENNEARLKRQKGVGNKTADYFKLLVGIPTTAVDRHMIKFLKLAGVDVADYAQAKEIIHRTADLMGLNRTVLDHSIWKFMSQGKSRNLCKSTRKNIYRGSANKIVSHGGKVLIKHPFNEVWDYLENEGPFHLNTSTGIEFEARATISENDKPVIKFFEKGREYARAYECCWGHYYNCNRTRFGMYAKALDESLGRLDS